MILGGGVKKLIRLVITSLRPNIFEKNKILIFCGNLVSWWYFETKNSLKMTKIAEISAKNEFQSQISGRKLHLTNQNLAKRSNQSSRMIMPNFMTSSQKIDEKSWKNIPGLFWGGSYQKIVRTCTMCVGLLNVYAFLKGRLVISVRPWGGSPDTSACSMGLNVYLWGGGGLCCILIVDALG